MKRNCQTCKYYKDGYCENLELKPCYPQKGCDDFSKRNELKKDTMQVLDKIRSEIEKAVWEDVIVSLDGTDETRISRLDPDDVFKIIDKYRAERSDTE